MDDTQSYVRVTPKIPGSISNTVAKIEACLWDVYSWMSKNMLKLNSDKTEIIILGTDTVRARSTFQRFVLEIARAELKVGPSLTLG